MNYDVKSLYSKIIFNDNSSNVNTHKNRVFYLPISIQTRNTDTVSAAYVLYRVKVTTLTLGFK